MKKIFCIIGLLFVVSGLMAQTKEQADQLREQLKANPKEDTTRVRKLTRLSTLSADIDEKERAAREAAVLSKKINDDKGLPKALLALADALTLRDSITVTDKLLDAVDSFGKATDNYELRAQAAFKRTNIRLTPDATDALKYNLQAVSYAEKGNNPASLAYIQYCAALLYMSSFGNYPKALEFFLAAEKTAENARDKTNLVFVWSGLSDLYERIGEHDKAYSYIRKAYESHTDTTDIDLTVGLQNTLAKSYEAKNRIPEALALFKKNINLAYDPYTIGYAESCAAADYVELDSLAPAFQYAFSALKKMSALKDTVLLSWVHYVLAKAYLEKNNTDSALYFATKGLDEAKKTDQLETGRDNAELLAQIYQKKNDYKNAYTYRDLFITYRDSITGTEVKNRAAVLGYNNELEKKETRITTLSRQQKLQQNFLISLSAALLLIIVTAIALLRNNRQKRLALEELKQTQAQLIQSEKMASLGELTAGIAHEIQNPLNFVNNFSEVNGELISELKSELATGNLQFATEIADDIQQNLEKVTHHGKRADAIVKGMLEHSRQSSGQKQLTDVNALADEYLKLAYHGMRAKDKEFNAIPVAVGMKTDFDNGIGKINVVPQDIGRVLLNLYNNAFYAVTAKASRIYNHSPGNEVMAEDKYEPLITVSTKRSNRNIEIKVADNGIGIPQDIVNKIFQPFFTTKPTGQGTGLGLSLAYDIVKAHGGEIKVETSENKGAAFIIQLPLQA